jgi:prepilin-type N-terminal cleavage/methylation domain-containing protein
MRSSLSPPRPARRGFTLVEMLVVIGIIAVLMSLLLPAVMRAREAASRAACANNLKQMGLACTAYHTQYGYFPTAGWGDYYGPNYSVTGAANNDLVPYGGWQQTAGWGFQVLPFLDEETKWLGGAAGSTAWGPRMLYTVGTPLKLFLCPSRRPPSWTNSFSNQHFTTGGGYSGTQNFPQPSGSYGTISFPITMAPTDYAGCLGNVNGGGIMLSQCIGTGTGGSFVFGRRTVQSTDVMDGLSHTILLGEKAANPRVVSWVNEDDMSFASGFYQYNFNAVRFTNNTVLPMRDYEITLTNASSFGAFGSAHPGTWWALMGDASVQAVSYTIDPNVYSALGTINGREAVQDADLQ